MFFNGLLATFVRYDDSLRQISSARAADETPARIKNAEVCVSLLECLVLELGNVDYVAKRITDSDIDKLFEALSRILKSSGPPQARFSKRNEALLVRLIEKWHGDITILVETICPYGYSSHDYFFGTAPNALHQRLTTALLPKFTSQVIAGFYKEDYVLGHIWQNTKISIQIRCLFRMPDGPLWATKRAEFIIMLQHAESDENVRTNAFELLDWFRHHFDSQTTASQSDAEAVKAILLKKEFLNPLWEAAIAKALAPRAAMQLNQFVALINRLGGNVNLPVWWETTVSASKTQGL